MRSTTKQSQSTRRTARRNPSRSVKRSAPYRESDVEVDTPLYSIKQHCWKSSDIQTGPSEVETESLTIDDQSESDSSGHHQSDVIETSSFTQNRPKCNICNKTFTKISALRLHIRTVHDKVKSFECPHCPHKATQRCHLEVHILTHTGDKNFKCNICDRKFTQSGNLRLHIRSVHDKIKAFECPHCPHKAARNVDIKTHILTHTGDKNFKCDICDRKFTRNSHLLCHVRNVHDKIKSFECPHCPHKAASSSNLKKHILTHTGKMNFKCNICDRKFTQSGSLKTHIRAVHDKIKAFPCPHCPFKASRSGNLKRHILTHTGEMNYKCDVCEKKFIESSNLKRHVRNVHGIIDHLTRFYNENQ